MSEAANYIALAIPVFFLLIGLELLVSRLQRTRLYRFNDAVTNISCGIAQQVLSALVKTLLLAGYLYLYTHHRWMEWPTDQWWTWVVLFIGVDFFYYWFHRYAHEISFMWGGHIVHHQSEEYNLSVALRQGAFQAFFSWIFYLPLALLGFAPLVFVVVNQLQTLYQFWIHTRTIGKLHPAFEYVFNTPSHHRVHHGINPRYIDKNHGGTLIIFDRMFGTFQEEEEEVVYGVTKPLRSWNPVWANLDFYRDLWRTARQCRSFGDVLRLLVNGPGWRPDYLGGPMQVPETSPQQHQKYDTSVPPGVNYYVLFQYVVVLGGTSAFLFLNPKLLELYAGWQGMGLVAAIAVWIYLGIAGMGGLLEGRSWAFWAEVPRMGMAFGLVLLLGPVAPWAIAGLAAWALLSGAWLSRLYGHFRSPGLTPPAS